MAYVELRLFLENVIKQRKIDLVFQNQTHTPQYMHIYTYIHTSLYAYEKTDGLLCF